MRARTLKYSFLLCLLLSISQLFAQSNYQPAFVIKNNGDSVSGQVDYRNWKKNPETIIFIGPGGLHQTFNPDSIQGIFIPSQNEVYTSYTVEVDMRPADAEEAIQSTFIDSPVLHKRVFLFQLIGSPLVHLYEYTDNNKEHFYFVKGNDTAIELIHYFTYDESRKEIKENEEYKEQLAELFSDCAMPTNSVKTIKFKKREIQNSFLQYLHCKVPGISPLEHKIEDAGTRSVGILVGVMNTTYNFTGSAVDFVDENYSSSFSPVFGVTLDIGLPRRRNQFHIVNELIYKSYKTSSTFTRPYTSYTVTNTVEVNFSYLQLNSMLRYVYASNGSLKPFINFGMGNAVMIAQNTNRLHQSYSFGNEDELIAFDGPHKYEFSLFAGIGLNIHRLEVEFRYAGSKKSFSPIHALDINPRSVQGSLLYRF